MRSYTHFYHVCLREKNYLKISMWKEKNREKITCEDFDSHMCQFLMFIM